MTRKAQASMEYMSTYIYAGLAIVIAVGALGYFGAFDKETYTAESCDSGTQLRCVDAHITTDGTLQVLLENRIGRPIVLEGFTVTYKGRDISQTSLGGARIEPGQQYEIIAQTGNNLNTGAKESFSYSVQFQPENSPNTLTVMGTATEKVEEAFNLLPPDCTNNVLEQNEECVGIDTTIRPCTDENRYLYYTGSYRCVDCRFNTDDCVELDEYNCPSGLWDDDGWSTNEWQESDAPNRVRCCPYDHKKDSSLHLYITDGSPGGTMVPFHHEESSCCPSQTYCVYEGTCHEPGATITITHDTYSTTHKFLCQEYSGSANWECQPQLLDDSEFTQGSCGTYYDGCDSMLPYDNCGQNMACDPSGHDCETSCDSEDEIDELYECGTHTSCTGSIDLGDCDPATYGERSVCNSETWQCDCEPYTQDDLPSSYECGTVSDGCLGTVTLGSCSPTQHGSNVACNQYHECACTPSTCDDLNLGTNGCGTFDNGCLQTIECGSCPSGLCDDNTKTCEVEDDDIVGAFTFEDPDLSTDDTGNIEIVSITNAEITEGAGVDGGSAIVLNGDDSHVDLGYWSIEGDQLTIAAWVWLDYYPIDSSTGQGEDPRIVAKGRDQNYQEWALLVERGKYPEFRIGGLSGNNQDINRANPDNKYDWRDTSIDWEIKEETWYHLAGTYDGTTLRLYFNGRLVARNSYSGTLRVDDTHPVWIGGQPTLETAREWPGVIDEVYILDTALTGDQIRELHDSMVTP